MTERVKASEPENQQQLMLIAEFRSSVKDVITGLCELNRKGAADDYFHLPMLLISTGIASFLRTFNRLLQLDATGKLPDVQSVRPEPTGASSNELRLLLTQLSQHCLADTSLHRHPQAAGEMHRLQTDDRIRRLIDTFSDFAMGARYYNMNIISGVEPPGACQADELEKLREEIMEEEILPQGTMTASDFNVVVDREICSRITIATELFMGTLSRLAAVGRSDEETNLISDLTSHFLVLSDEDLGKTDYSRMKP